MKLYTLEAYTVENGIVSWSILYASSELVDVEPVFERCRATAPQINWRIALYSYSNLDFLRTYSTSFALTEEHTAE